MVDGSFDPLHDGHIAYFIAAQNLGNPVLCNIASDQWTQTKHAILLEAAQRAAVIDSIRYIDLVHISTATTASVLSELKPAVYAKGSDWRDRGGIPKQEQEICSSHGIKVVYLDTIKNSSSELLQKYSKGTSKKHD